MKKCLFILLFVCCNLVQADELTPFTTDGCSMFPNGNPKHKSLWLQCCIQHDLAYWMGGTEQQRLDADLALEQCVKDTGEPDIAKLMLNGVRIGGTPYLPSTYRWGYGWSFNRGYKALTDEERSQVEDQLNGFKILLDTQLNHLRNNHESGQIKTDNSKTK